jgi:hypothetical protein
MISNGTWEFSFLPSQSPSSSAEGRAELLLQKNQLLRRSFVFFLSTEEYPNHNQGDLISDMLQAGIWNFSQRNLWLKIFVEEPMLFIVECTSLHGQENKIGCEF